MPLGLMELKFQPEKYAVLAGTVMSAASACVPTASSAAKMQADLRIHHPLEIIKLLFNTVVRGAKRRNL